MFNDKLPARVRVLILGGGVHGVGVLHDLASRGWKDCHLLEKGSLGSGTSSRSTKLIHGGLRYLKHLSQFGMVAESLRERRLLMEVAKDLVKPIKIFLPINKQDIKSQLIMKSGLFFYDVLAGKYNIGKHQLLAQNEYDQHLGIFDNSKFSKVYSFWDAQTDDLALVRRNCSFS